MKKIFFYVLMFVMMGHINAQGGLYSEWTEEYPIGIPKDVIQSETRYKWYKEDIIDIEYLKKEDIYNKLESMGIKFNEGFFTKLKNWFLSLFDFLR